MGISLPTSITPLIRRLAVASLIGQIVLVVTGGAVRLTGSGLGCPEWPRCTPDSVVNTPEMGIHGVIEFGNRALTVVLGLLALSMVVALWNLRKSQPTIFWLAASLLLAIPAQAILGGITVLTGLNPWVVGAHFLVSAGLIVVAMHLVNRVYARPPENTAPVRPLLRQLAVIQWILVVVTVILGVVVTGSGPHAGSEKTPRNGLDPDLVARLHVAPVYLLVAVSVLLVVLCWQRGAGSSSGSSDVLRSASIWLLILVLAQGVIGYAQYFTGLPILLVGLHMLGAALLLAAGTNLADVSLRARRA